METMERDGGQDSHPLKACGYCGRENQAGAVHCSECGTAFAAAVEVSDAAKHGELNARFATRTLFLYLGLQIGVGILVGFIAALAGGPRRGLSGPTGTYATIVGIGTVLVMMTSGVVALLTCLSRLRTSRLVDTSPAGAAWVRGAPSRCFQGLAAGILVSGGYILLLILVGYSDGNQSVGPITRMAGTPGIARAMWLLLALILAPIMEELLFRGVVYGGFRHSFGPVWSGVLVTGIFWLLHIGETIHHWPSMLGILALALVTLWFRLKSEAVGPAIAAHFGYNATLAVVVLCTT